MDVIVITVPDRDATVAAWADATPGERASRARHARRQIDGQARTAYRFARTAGVEATTVALENVEHEAAVLAFVARQSERARWAALARHLHAGDLHEAASVLDELGYETAGHRLARVWQCRCGWIADGPDLRDQHIADPESGSHPLSLPAVADHALPDW